MPVFGADPDRTFFEVELPIHPYFTKRSATDFDLQSVVWDLEGIDALMERILKSTNISIDDIADDIAVEAKMLDSQEVGVFGDIADDIAAGIESVVTAKQVDVLRLCRIQTSRIDLFRQLNLARHPGNFKAYIQPLVGLGWLSMTLPDKPTSPNQQYLTTLKGRMILQFLQRGKSRK